MSERPCLSRRIIRIVAIVFASLVLSSPHAFAAMAQYKVWYFDDVFETFQEGDVSDGNTKLVPPSWACGLLFDDPSYYRWVNGYGNTMSSADFWKDVIVWMPLPGCPHNEPVIEYEDGSHTFAHPAGASYMEISTHYGVYWVDENGGWPTCNACVSVKQFTYFIPEIDYDVAISTTVTLKAAILDTRQQTAMTSQIGQLKSKLGSLAYTTQQRVTLRRRTSLGDREGGVRSLEDSALRSLASAQQQLAACQTHAKTNQFANAHVACDLAGQDLAAAQSALTTAARFFGVGAPLLAGSR